MLRSPRMLKRAAVTIRPVLRRRDLINSTTRGPASVIIIGAGISGLGAEAVERLAQPLIGGI